MLILANKKKPVINEFTNHNPGTLFGSILRISNYVDIPHNQYKSIFGFLFIGKLQYMKKVVNKTECLCFPEIIYRLSDSFFLSKHLIRFH